MPNQVYSSSSVTVVGDCSVFASLGSSVGPLEAPSVGLGAGVLLLSFAPPSNIRRHDVSSSCMPSARRRALTIKFTKLSDDMANISAVWLECAPFGNENSWSVLTMAKQGEGVHVIIIRRLSAPLPNALQEVLLETITNDWYVGRENIA